MALDRKAETKKSRIHLTRNQNKLSGSNPTHMKLTSIKERPLYTTQFMFFCKGKQ